MSTDHTEIDLWRETLKHQLAMLEAAATSFETVDPGAMTAQELQDAFRKIASIYRSVAETTEQQLKAIDVAVEYRRETDRRMREVQDQIEQFTRDFAKR